MCEQSGILYPVGFMGSSSDSVKCLIQLVMSLDGFSIRTHVMVQKALFRLQIGHAVGCHLFGYSTPRNSVRIVPQSQ